MFSSSYGQVDSANFHQYAEILSKHLPFYHQNYGLLSTFSLAEIMRFFPDQLSDLYSPKDAAYIVLVVLIAYFSVSGYCLQKGTSIL